MKYYFYGEECPHCHIMMPIVDKLIEEGIKIEKLETWHNEENAELFDKKEGAVCGGVPYFFDDDSKEAICGEVSEEVVRAWAKR